jgi:hypothetical protein
MRIARLGTAEGTRHVVWAGEAWEVVEDYAAEPPVVIGVFIAPG